MTVTIFTGCCLALLQSLPEKSVHTCVTSPPYWQQRNYDQEDQLGLEATPDEYIANMVRVFHEVHRVLREDGTLWLNLGDTFLPGKQLGGIPWRVAFALQADGWILRSEIVWEKPNAMPDPTKDRPTRSHEYIFLLTKNERYYYDHEAIKEDIAPETAGRYRYGFGTPSKKKAILDTGHWHTGKDGRDNLCGKMKLQPKRNKRSVWKVPTKSCREAHFATYPPALIEPCIRAGAPVGGTVLDPFFGAGTTGMVAEKHGRHTIGVELNPEYVRIAEKRLTKELGMFAEIVVAA